MLTVFAIILALFVLEGPWRIVAVVAGLTLDVAENVVLLWWSRRRSSVVGTETLVGRTARVVTPCRPRGQVRLGGELWQAECPEGADPGDRVEVLSVEGLLLAVRPAAGAE